MGLLRFYLAIAVVIAHSHSLFGISFAGGVVAVQIFFIISGFYMTLILNEKYVGQGSYKLFISNRFLKIFPAYFIVLAFSVVVYLIIGLVFNNWGRLEEYIINWDFLSFTTLFYLISMNLTIFFQDLSLFLGIDKLGELYFTSNFRVTEIRVHKFLVIPQAWSLSLELMFYLIAPFVVRKNIQIIIFFIVLSIILRVFIYIAMGWNFDPWNYRFFLNELALFLGGAVSYKLYKNYLTFYKKNINYLNFMLASLFVFLLMGYQLLKIDEYFIDIKNFTLYLVLIILLPYIFLISKDNNLDRALGELSYPIYIVHLTVIELLSFILVEKTTIFLIITIAVSISMSLLLIKYIIKPIERYRQKRVKGVKI